MKTIFSKILVVILLLIVTIACSKDVPVANINVSQGVAILAVGDTLTLTATVFPRSATNQTLIWSSSDATVASVIDGKITALSGGLTSIIATAEDGNQTGTCAVMVSWNTELFGITTFATAQTWKVGSQVWSDAVETSFCSNRTSFDGGYIEHDSIGWVISVNLNIDCRSNPGQKGDLFSWRAVSERGNDLCPAPWRVPTLQDFMNLNTALGGTGGSIIDMVLLNRYLNDWGGTFAGNSTPTGDLYGQSWQARYWSQSERWSDTGSVLLFGSDGFVHLNSSYFKNGGLSLRCVRDVQ